MMMMVNIFVKYTFPYFPLRASVFFFFNLFVLAFPSLSCEITLRWNHQINQLTIDALKLIRNLKY